MEPQPEPIYTTVHGSCDFCGGGIDNCPYCGGTNRTWETMDTEGRSLDYGPKIIRRGKFEPFRKPRRYSPIDFYSTTSYWYRCGSCWEPQHMGCFPDQRCHVCGEVNTEPSRGEFVPLKCPDCGTEWKQNWWDWEKVCPKCHATYTGYAIVGSWRQGRWSDERD